MEILIHLKVICLNTHATVGRSVVYWVTCRHCRVNFSLISIWNICIWIRTRFSHVEMNVGRFVGETVIHRKGGNRNQLFARHPEWNVIQRTPFWKCSFSPMGFVRCLSDFGGIEFCVKNRYLDRMRILKYLRRLNVVLDFTCHMACVR